MAKITAETLKKFANGRLTEKQIEAVLKVQANNSLQETADAIKKALGDKEPTVHKITVGERDGKGLSKVKKFTFQTNKDTRNLNHETVFGLMFEAEKVSAPAEMVELTDSWAAKKSRQMTGPEGALTFAAELNRGE